MRELSGVAWRAPAGFCSFAGTRPKSSPVIRLFSILVDRDLAAIQIHTADQIQPFDDARVIDSEVADLADSLKGDDSAAELEATAVATDDGTEQIEVPLERLAWARSGDKGDKANIGVMAQREYFPWIAAALTAPLRGKPV